MTASLSIKFYLVKQLTEYSNDSNLSLYTLSELLVLTLFCVFKQDEDCFACFNRCQDIPIYSIFQMGANSKGLILLESSECETSHDFKERALIQDNINRTSKIEKFHSSTISEASCEESRESKVSTINSVASSYYVNKYIED
jgi:hypothetical protein